jgi:hypothetical protein
MLWIYARHHQVVLIEATYDNDAGDYVVIVHHPSNGVRTERFADRAGLSERVRDCQRSLENDHWVRVTAPAWRGGPASPLRR